MKSKNYKNRESKIKNAVILYLCILGNTFVFAQNETLLDKLDYNLIELKSVEHSDKTGNKQKAKELLLDLYRKKENLYLKVSDKDLKYFRVNFPKEVTNTLKNANDVLNKKFIFREDWDMEKTNIPYTFKDEMDWKAIPNGDEEWCFMLNRHKYWVDLGRAYYLTGDEKYAKGFIAQVNHWINNNPLDDSLKKYSWRRIEAGIRCENWIKSFEYIKNSKYVTPKFFEKFLNALYQHGTYLNASFSNFSKTSNWGVIEFHGLFNLALFMDDFKIANQWKTNAVENLKTCIPLQILDDGSQWEQSPMYHNEVFHCFMNVNLIAQRKNYNLPQKITTTTKEMALVNVKWQKPNYHQPLLGDSDDTDLRGLLTLASSLFNDPVLKSRAFEKYDYESFFIMGKKIILLMKI